MTAVSHLPSPGMPRTFALVPVKQLSQAKKRLGAALSPEARSSQDNAMLGDVLTT